jgi:hypothetical protein
LTVDPLVVNALTAPPDVGAPSGSRTQASAASRRQDVLRVNEIAIPDLVEEADQFAALPVG